ncbi:hypothetical protein [Saccharothrix violaceirubra]|uniref:Uncharacterized protein n=1 Tax=Saccharothrix violaceirubra TaxID=413306 RepID=A0A7W7WX15_9PSEU|nr:hypothetical protein [Saccharothrix violaceirubra]MBB4966661.1 hypothetical protein [Saccharothrix violaceirubra]
MTADRCPRPDCGGTVEDTGFCDTCFRRPDGTPRPVAPPPAGRRTTGGLRSLPVFEFPTRPAS